MTPQISLVPAAIRTLLAAGGGKGAGRGAGTSGGPGTPRAAAGAGEPGLRDGMGHPQDPLALGCRWAGGGPQPPAEQLPGQCPRARPAPRAGGRQRAGRHVWLAMSEMGFYGPESPLAPILHGRCQGFPAAWALAAPEVGSPLMPAVGVSGLTEIRLHLATLH